MKVCLLVMLSVMMMSCTGPVTSYKDDRAFFVNVVSWNLQTFFDGADDGIEYSQYTGNAWSQTKYQSRLVTLCDFIRETDADIYVFQEIENSAILQDIANELVGMRAVKKGYEYSCFAKEEGDALGVAILSRFPLEDITVHQINYKTSLNFNNNYPNERIADGVDVIQPSTRPILHAKVCVSDTKCFSLYACHWKSKYGGAEKSEIWRNAQERKLTDLLLENTGKYLVAGDFNRTLEEFIGVEEVIEKSLNFNGLKNNLRINSPWLWYTKKIDTLGSYYYDEKWETLDHFFYNDALEVVDFKTIKTPLTVNENGFPNRYFVGSNKGSSDHLPIFCVLEF